jgi:hypothetical protein
MFFDYDFEKYMCKYLFTFIDNYRFLYREDVEKRYEKEQEERKAAMARLNAIFEKMENK